MSEPTLELPRPIQSFLTAQVRHAVIATLDRNGSPHQAVVWFLLRDGVVVLNSRAGRRWPSNLMRDPRMSLSVEAGDDAVTLFGTCQLEDDGERAQADIAEMARRYYAPEKAEREISRFRTEQRLRFVLRPHKFHVHGDPH